MALSPEEIQALGAQQDFGKAQSKPLSDMERMIVTNIFDTNMKARSKYLKKLGYELDPSDDDHNRYRPIGSKGEYIEIDPGFSAYLKPGGLAEVWKDAKDLSFDTVAAPLITGTAAAGSAAAGGTGSGNPMIAAVAGLLGGAVGADLAEEYKRVLGEQLLNEGIERDAQDRVVYALTSGAVNYAAQFGRGAMKDYIKTGLEKTKNVIANIASQGNKTTKEALKAIGDNPLQYLEMNFQGARKRLTDTYNGLLGRDPVTAVAPEEIKGGAFRTKMDELNSKAASEVERLSRDPAFDVNIKETFLDPLAEKAEALQQKIIGSEDAVFNSEAKAQMEFLKKVHKDIQNNLYFTAGDKDVAARGTIKPVINFKEANELAVKLRQMVYGNKREDIPAMRGSSAITDLVTESAGSPQNFITKLKQNSSALGSPYADIKAEQSNLLNVYNNAVSKARPDTIEKALIFGDNQARTDLANTFAEMDSALGTNYSEAIQTGSLQAHMENLYKEPSKMTEKAVEGAASGAWKGGLIGSAAGAATGAGSDIGAITGGAIGAGIGAARGAVKDPRTAVSAIKGLTGAQGAVEGAMSSIPAELATAGVAQEISKSVVPQRNQAEEIFEGVKSGSESSGLSEDDIASLLEGI